MATPTSTDDIPVSHNEAEHRFETLVDGQLSICEYHVEADKWVFTHTFVPSILRGRGIAQKLVEVALRTAQDQNKKVVPSCSYVAAFISRRPEFMVLLA